MAIGMRKEAMVMREGSYRNEGRGYTNEGRGLGMR